MSNLVIVLVIGAGSYLLRLSFIGLLGTRAMPTWAEQPLKYVAPAVLAALVLPAVLLVDGRAELAPAVNPRFLAALAAGLFAWRLRNVAGVILVGMSLLWILEAVA
ncbi:MAG: AzlD domain-containing protein [Acidimicrobiia bacterium]